MNDAFRKNFFDQLRVLAIERIGDVGHAVALVSGQNRRVAARVDDRAARIVERDRQAEGFPFLDLGNRLQHLVRGQQIEPAELIVGTPIAPGRADRAVFPAWVVGHGNLPIASTFGFGLFPCVLIYLVRIR
jgi:hypothetical protein